MPRPPGLAVDRVAAALAALTAGPGPLLVIADFDGTLAAGSRDPAASPASSRRAARALRRAGRGRRGAVRTRPRRGPDRTDRGGCRLACRVGGDRVPRRSRAAARDASPAAVGPSGSGRDRPGVRRAAPPGRRSWRSGWPHELGTPPWLFVERKGPSVAFHVRQADDVPAARAAVLDAIAAVERREGLGRARAGPVPRAVGRRSPSGRGRWQARGDAGADRAARTARRRLVR